VVYETPLNMEKACDDIIRLISLHFDSFETLGRALCVSHRLRAVISANLPAIYTKHSERVYHGKPLANAHSPTVVLEFRVFGVLHSLDDAPALVTNHLGWPGLAFSRYRGGRLHRDGDRPAVVSAQVRCWYQDGQLHRDGDKPAKTSILGHEWYQRGQLHRDGDKPAKTSILGYEWYQRGLLHRDGDKPAKTSILGHEWYQRGQLHRDGDKPAEVHCEGPYRLGLRPKPLYLGYVVYYKQGRVYHPYKGKIYIRKAGRAARIERMAPPKRATPRAVKAAGPRAQVHRAAAPPRVGHVRRR
jgi:hypothetical protein